MPTAFDAAKQQVCSPEGNLQLAVLCLPMLPFNMQEQQQTFTRIDKRPEVVKPKVPGNTESSSSDSDVSGNEDLGGKEEGQDDLEAQELLDQNRESRNKQKLFFGEDDEEDIMDEEGNVKVKKSRKPK